MPIFHNGSTGVVTLASFFDEIDRVFPQSAVVTFTLFDQNNTAITGATDIAMAQVSGTTGRATLYRGRLPHTVALPEGTEGVCTITATHSGKRRKFPEIAIYEG